MNLEEIKTAVRAGRTVYWSNPNYEVKLYQFKDGSEQWLVKCLPNRHCIGLTWADGVTLNGEEKDFYVKG